MSINSITFIFIFLPIAIALYYISPRKIKETVLLILSIIFYATWSVKRTIILIIITCLNILLARTIYNIIQKKFKKILFIVGITINVGLLCFYKLNLRSIILKLFSYNIKTLNLLVPLGISFFVFKSISYLTDTYIGKIELKGSIIKDALYLSFFAQIQSGPLSRYGDLFVSSEKQLFQLFSVGVQRFLVGFSKKCLLASMLSNVTAEVFATSIDHISFSYAWLGSICFSLQLFLDFSGYSDMAIGISNIFGYECPKNFDYPYMTSSVSEFWKRWHITLGKWFRDYIYIPLGGSKNNSKVRVIFNLLVVWLLTSLWHGTTWNYIIWGLGYFIIICIEKIFNIPKCFNKKWKILYKFFTLLFINFQWVYFNTSDISFGTQYILKMIIPNNNKISDNRTLFLFKSYWLFITIGIITSTPIIRFLKTKFQKKFIVNYVIETLYQLILFFAFFWSISIIGKR